ncbi:hypothetical protein GQX73_g7203 [Xylaria multiplex]|uniref:Uncharacterized protein n=1 Tax=Xylaria multiplex TaxID=323545 RepID=A0A7C8IL51_9PEZI|nr:hypothetical protein GQX73_g7203 [Xylaria multiplex]
MVAVGAILVTSDLDVVDVGIDVVADVGTEIITEVVDVRGKELVDTGIEELEVGSVVFSGIDTLDEGETGGGVEVGIPVVVLDGISVDVGGSVDDITGGVVVVPLAIGVEVGVKVTGTLTVSDETGTSVLFPPGDVGTGVEDVGTKVDVGPTPPSVEFVGTNVEEGMTTLSEGVGVTDGSVELPVGSGNKLVTLGVSTTDKLELGVGVADDSVEFAVGPGSKLVISGIRPPVELELGVGVTSEDEAMVDVPVSVSVSLTVASLVGDAVTVPFEVVDPGSKILVKSSSRPPLLEVEVGESEVEAEVGVDVVVTAPVGNRIIPEDDVDVAVGVESLVVSSAVEADAEELAEEVAFAIEDVDESELSPGNPILGKSRVGRDKRGPLVVVVSSLTVEDPVEDSVEDDSSSSLEVDLVVDAFSLALVVVESVSLTVAVFDDEVVLESVSFLELESVADGATKTVVGTTTVVVPLSLSEDVSSPKPRLARMSDIVSLLVDDEVTTSARLLD